MKNYKFFFFFITLIISTIFLINYEYNKLYFFLLSIFSNGYLILSFSRRVHLFHLFNAFFLWMGFWLKIIIVYRFYDLNFAELNNETKNYLIFFDESALVSLVGIAGFFFSLLFNLYYSPLNQNEKKIFSDLMISNFVKNNKNYIIVFFSIIIVVINYLNFNYSIYQKGIVSNQEINKYILAIFKWLLLFGLTSFSSLIIYHLLLKKEISIKILFLTLLENFLTSLSLLSRGMFINFMAIFFGIIKYSQINKLINYKKPIILYLSIFSILFLSSLFLVKDLRTKIYFDKTLETKMDQKNDVKLIQNTTKYQLKEIFHLISHRFVGFEGVLAVSNYENKSFDFFKSSFYSNDHKNLIFNKIIKNENMDKIQSNKKNTYFIKVPGIIAFLYYSGSLIFLFCSCLILGIILCYFEKFIIRFSNDNIIFASLISQIMAYRLSNFGYMPQNTYLLITTVLLNLFIVFLFYFLLTKLKNFNE